MDSIAGRLDVGSRVGLDTSFFISHLEGRPHQRVVTHEILAGIEEGYWQGITSVITLMELTAYPWQLGRGAVARHYEALLTSFPNLQLISVDQEIAHRAAQLSARYELPFTSALHAATCITQQTAVFVTGSHRFERLQDLIDIMWLDNA